MHYTLTSDCCATVEIRKSRFIAYVFPVENRDAAMALLHHLRETHPDATHVCWALLAGGQSGMSDDGEPSGTAGRPILEVLRHHALDGVLGAVVRYYGGVKLGAGGLMRAYTEAIANVLSLAQRVQHIDYIQLVIELSYADEARVRHWVEQQADVTLTNSAHAMSVCLTLRLPAHNATSTRQALSELTQGRISFIDHPPPLS